MSAMDCPGFLDRLDALLEGRLPEEERRAAAEHLRGCARCRGIEKAFREGPGDLALEPPPGLAAAVLERTSGPACRSAQARLCDHADGSLDPVERELVQGHLNRCPGCAGVARALAWMDRELPALAEIEPGPGFAQRVLARTTRLRRRAARPPEIRPRLWQRPRIAWEAAYAGTVVLLLLFGTPHSPLAGAPGRVLSLASPGAVSRLGLPVAPVRARLSRVRSGWAEAAAAAELRARDLAAGVSREAAAALDIAREGMRTFRDGIASGLENDETGPPPPGGGPSEGMEP